MKSTYSMLFIVALALCGASQANPIDKIISMITDLEAKVQEEGKVSVGEYEEYAEWCEDTSKNLQYEIKTGKAEVADLTATIEKMTAEIEAAETKIEELVASIASNEKDLSEATETRATEAADFAELKKELTTTIDMLERATGIIEKEMAKSGASMLQLPGANNVLQALNIMINSGAIGSGDGQKLTALVQSSQQSEDDDSDSEAEEALGAPAGKVYESKGGGIVEVLTSMTDKATAELEESTKKEEAAVQNFEMLKQSLTDEISFATTDKADTAAAKEEYAETKATAEGDLSVTKSDLAEDEKALAQLHSECMTHANDFEVETKSRGEELKALATAKKIIQEATGGATAVSYSFLQLSKASTRSIGFDVIRFVRDLAKKKNSRVLAQLASKMNTATKLGSSESDVFAKIKSMITDMIANLEKEAASAAGEKEYCDKETSETTAKKEKNEAELKKLSTKIDQASAASAKLKEEVSVLQGELASLAKSSAEAGKLRSEEKAIYDSNSSDLKKGIDGVAMALKVLKDYYAQDSAHGSSEGAGSGIISLLEVCQSDFEKDLSEMTAIENQAAAEFEKMTKEDDLTKTIKDQDVKYKTKEYTSLDKTIGELSGDKEGVSTEQDAVLEYLAKINDRCIAKATPYEEIKKRREEEIAGLQEGLEILESETVFVQKSISRRTLRGKKH